MMGYFFEFVVIQDDFFWTETKKKWITMDKTGVGLHYSISMFFSENFVYFYLI